MSDPESAALTDKQLREMAKESAKLMNRPFKFINGRLPETKYTLMDVLHLGVAMAHVANESFFDNTLKGENREFFEKFYQSRYDMQAFEDFLYAKFAENPPSAQEFVDGMAQVDDLNSKRWSGMRMVRSAMAELLGSGKPGRPKLFEPATEGKRLLDMSDAFYPFCVDYVQLQMEHPKKRAADLCDFLQDDHAQYASAAKRHSKFVESVTKGNAYLRAVQPKTKARRLADAMAGKQVSDLKPEYACQVAGELRRAANRDCEGN